jgi:hypothetical protein
LLRLRTARALSLEVALGGNASSKSTIRLLVGEAALEKPCDGIATR